MVPTLIALLFASQMNCPLHEQHMKERSAANPAASHGNEVNARHDTFGMSHATSHHNFRMFRDGGAIELRANNAGDTRTVATIRKHLREIVTAFAKDDFSTPAFVHGYSPDGIAEMKRLREHIRYEYQEIESGGRIRMTTTDAGALAALHDFVKFQTIEHHTDDRAVVEEDWRP